jgi:outer membrane protein
MRRSIVFAALITMAAISAPVSADAGDWLVRVGVSNVDPKSNNGKVAGTDIKFEVDDATSLTFDVTYMLNDNWGLELLAAWPFEHDISLEGVGKVGKTKQLPPTLSLQYHWTRWGKFKPYVGAGVNYTYFFDVDTNGPLAGSNLDLEDSWGFAGQFGIDYSFNEKWFGNINARYIMIETKANLDGPSVGTVQIDPFVYGFNVGYRF